MKKPKTKQGKYGTLFQYQISYRDDSDPSSPVFSSFIWGYDRDHAVEKWYDCDSDGWEIIDTSCVPEYTGPSIVHKFS